METSKLLEWVQIHESNISKINERTKIHTRRIIDNEKKIKELEEIIKKLQKDE